MELYLIQNLLHSQRNNKMKRQPTEWKKVFANHVLDKGLLSKIHKEVIQLNNTKPKEFG